ncbi:hypothetical protein DBY65_005420 [Pseudomonas sp. RIT412]|nr:hypothetical protein DBP26_005245 [Pseudomonas sp. RIT 409]RAU55357.1 hypothetical protein DBY65_005420 [Pseudomonas sp. RIT 412]
MDQITGDTRSVQEGPFSLKHAHQRLSLMLTERLDHATPPQALMGGVTHVRASCRADERKFARS